jgi:hypothetical protein
MNDEIILQPPSQWVSFPNLATPARLGALGLPIRLCLYALALAVCCGKAGLSVAQDHDVLCNEGEGGYESEFFTGVALQVRAARNGPMAVRACQATLSWGKNNLIVAANASQLDVDTFGTDLGLGTPVTTLQIKQSAADCCLQYQVYSLKKPPRLLRTITGGEYFTASDKDLDGHVEIWTNDAAAIQSFEDLSLGELDAPPALVLRFTHNELLDVSSEFQPYFDRQIEGLRRELKPEDLRDFKNTNGRLIASASISPETLHRRRGVKTKILEIAWAYLYSGREQQARSWLTEVWPPTDLARIQAALTSARAHGIKSQVDGESTGLEHARKPAQIFDAIGKATSGRPEVSAPNAILLRRPPLGEVPNAGSEQSDILLELVIDSAGKVRSAERAGKAQPLDTALLGAATGWKFVPAFKDGRAVASRMRLKLSLKQ